MILREYGEIKTEGESDHDSMAPLEDADDGMEYVVDGELLVTKRALNVQAKEDDEVLQGQVPVIVVIFVNCLHKQCINFHLPFFVEETEENNNKKEVSSYLPFQLQNGSYQKAVCILLLWRLCSAPSSLYRQAVIM